MGAIFISYRRDDAEGQAGRLFGDLSHHFGKDAVFMDVAAIEPGRDFRKVIDQQVSVCGVLLALVGRKWLDAVDETATRRLDDPMDFVRLETASALRRDIPVVPVLVQGAKMPKAEQLPDELKEFAFRNAVELTHARWDSDVQVLIRALQPYVQATGAASARAPLTPPAPPEPARPAWRAPAAAAAAVVVLGVGVSTVWRPLAVAPTTTVGSEPTTPVASKPDPSTAPAVVPGPAGAASKAPVISPALKASSGLVNPGVKPPPPQVKPAATVDPQPSTGAPTVEPQPQPVAAPPVSLVGTWKAEGCDLVIVKDDGKEIDGHCDAGIEHRLTGRYVSRDTARITVTRIDKKTPCELTVSGKIEVLDKNAIRYSQDGWKGCGNLDTGYYERILQRR